MTMYELPKFNPPKFFQKKLRRVKLSKTFLFIILIILTSSFFGFLAGAISGSFFFSEVKDYLAKINIEIPEPQIIEKVIEKQTIKEYQPQTTQEEKIIQVVKNVSPSVVSIIVTKDVPIIEQYYFNPFEGFDFQIQEYREKGTEKKNIGGGTGFIVSEHGMVLTNKHVVSNEDADYTVLTNDGNKYPAKVLAVDPFRDLAIIKIEAEKKIDEQGELDVELFPLVKFGDSDKLQIGQTVITIGNALGEFRNTVSVGVISGLGRTVTASGPGIVETVEDVIQTDAAINIGNSGGPLLNLKGEVIGVNFAMAQLAENIGFAIPVNKAKKDIEQVKTLGRIVYPFLGVRYVLINEQIKKENNLSVDYGALIISGDVGESAIFPDSPAEKAGLEQGDIILEFDKEKITTENSLAKIIQKYDPGDRIVLKILKAHKEQLIPIILDEWKE